VHSLPEARLDPDRARTTAGRLKMLAVLLVCAAPVVASYWMYFVVRPQSTSAYATLIQPTVPLPDLVAADLDGHAVPLRKLVGQWLLVVVARGGCDSTCEQRLYEQRQLHAMMGRERGRVDKIWLVIDDAPVRTELIWALTGPGDAVQILRLPAAAVASWLKPAPAQALSDHLYLVDPMGEWMMRTPAKLEPAQFKRDLERLLRASAFWDRPGR
jgi:hypothetical protein